MKHLKFILSGILFISLFGITSCKKEYSCKCTLYFENGASLIGTDKVQAKNHVIANDKCQDIGEKDAEGQSAEVASYECIVS